MTYDIDMTPEEWKALISDPRFNLSGPGAHRQIKDLATEVLGHERARKALVNLGYMVNTGWRGTDAMRHMLGRQGNRAMNKV